jgi:alginate O-acetyltransferase complex protein AlgI
VTEKWRKQFNSFVYLNHMPRLHNLLQILITFFPACVAWVFFRANSTQDSFMIIQKAFIFQGPLYIGSPAIFIYSLFGIAFLIAIEYKKEYYKGNFSFFNHPHWFVRKLSYSFLIVLILFFGVFDGGQFIYFQF